jgi:hypothetical protein
MHWVEMDSSVTDVETWWLLGEEGVWCGGVELDEHGKYTVETNESINEEMEFDTLEEAQAYVVVLVRMEGA